MTKPLFSPISDIAYYATENVSLLRLFGTAISVLYDLSDILSRNTCNASTYVTRLIDSFGIDLVGTAEKLSMMRSLLFGDDLDWDLIARHLSKVAARKLSSD